MAEIAAREGQRSDSVDRARDGPVTAEDEVLADAACWQLLRSVDLGRLALASSHGLEIFPVNFVVDRGTIVFRTATGSKLTWLTRSPDVAFEADGAEAGRDTGGEAVMWSVVVKGTASKVEARHDVLDLFGVELRPWHASTKPYFVRLEPRTVSGRRFVRRS